MTIQQIEQDETYQQILKDSFGGVMYNVANKDKYDGDHLIALWDGMTDGERLSAGGIMKGALGFLKGDI